MERGSCGPLRVIWVLIVNRLLAVVEQSADHMGIVIKDEVVFVTKYKNAVINSSRFFNYLGY